jgi:hypothetical protein
MRRLRTPALVLFFIFSIWTLWLVVAGGVDTTLFGMSIRSNDPMRPFALANLALLLFVVAGPGIQEAWTRLGQAAARIDDRVPALIMAFGVAVLGLSYATTVANGADAYGYVSQADLWLTGNLRIDQPWVAELPWPNAEWTAAPLGYRPAPSAETPAIVPIFSPGLPLLMALAKRLFGHAAVFSIVPLSGALLVLATFGIGRRLGSSRIGLAAAWFLATSPIVLFMLMTPMTDVPAAAAWAVAFYACSGRARHRRSSAGSPAQWRF